MEASIAESTSKVHWGIFLEKHGMAVSTAVCALAAVLAWLAGRMDLLSWEAALYGMAYIAGGYRKAWEGLQTLLYEHDLDVDLLMVVAALGAASIGFWQDGAVLILIFSLSGALESYTLKKTDNDIRSIMKLRPETALVLKDKQEIPTRAEDLRRGDIILVKPGERIAADGVVTEGVSTVNQASITGEAIPVDKDPGQDVFAGTINGYGTLLVTVTKAAKDTLLARIIKLVQEAQSERPPSQLFIERFEGVYAKAVVAGAILVMAVPPLLWGWTWEAAIYKAMNFLVVASPCALVSSIMPAVLAGISNGARHGILFKGGAHLEAIGSIQAVAFDKTGTLTEGALQVRHVVSVAQGDEAEVLRLAAGLEALSEHPIAKALVQEAKNRGLSLPEASGLQAVPGVGVYGLVEKQFVRVVSEAGLTASALEKSEREDMETWKEQGKTLVFVEREGILEGMIALQDALRPQAPEAVNVLRQMGLRVVMLTGDAQATANALGREAGVQDVYAELLPEQKLQFVRQLTQRHGSVAMIGDGVNDAPALAASEVGVAMGAAGTDVALETAKVVLMADDLSKVSYAIELGRRTNRIVKQNIAFAFSVMAFLVAGVFWGEVNLPIGVVGHEGSTILVILNGLRLLR